MLYVQVRIDEAGALRNQRYAFTDRFTLVSELMQNARRAGATCVRIDYDAGAQVLRVADDGRGVADFASLLVFHASGWDADTQRRERAFGVGFSKCLYSATRCIVRSRGQRLEFDTAQALARTPIPVVPDPEMQASGTHVELHGVALDGLDVRMAALCRGFPIPVAYNGHDMPRPHALDLLDTIATEIGAVSLAGSRTGNASTSTVVYLQGFRVLSPSCYSPGHVNVVHLDPERFLARLPDRDRLIDEDEQLRRIERELRHQWRAILEVAKAELPAETFVARYYDAMRAYRHLDLLNDVDVLPPGVCEAIAGYPVIPCDGEADCLEPIDTPIARARIASGQIALVELDDLDTDNTAHWMHARARGCRVFHGYKLDDAHWCMAHVRALQEEPIAVEPLGQVQRTWFDGRGIGIDVVLCDKVRIRIGEHAVDIADEAVHHAGVLYIPAGESTGDGVRQVSSYIDGNDSFLEHEVEADREALADLIRRLRSVDATDTLDSLLRELRLEKYPVLHGKSFRLSIAGGANAHALEQIA